MPETFTVVPCKSRDVCKWDEELWLKAIDPNSDPAVVSRYEPSTFQVSAMFRIKDSYSSPMPLSPYSSSGE
jgi:hypothetical protein